MFTMRPHFLRYMSGSAYLVSRNAPTSITRTMYSQRSSGKSSTGETCCSPALFTRMSTPPHSLRARSTSARQSSREEMSARCAIAPFSGVATARSCASSMSARSTRAPRPERSSAIARPMPLAAPVTSAVFPVRSTLMELIRDYDRAAMSVLETRDLVKECAGFRAVDGVSLALDDGKVHALVGPNGAGKTTLFHMLTGFVKPSSARLVAFGTDVAGLPPDRISRMGVARSFHVTDPMSLRFWVPESAVARYRGRALSILSEVGLADVAARPAGSLPYGQKRALEL